jgi:hypothetical protein
MMEKHKRRRRREEKFACKAKSGKSQEKERNTHKIFPPCIISLLYQAR